MSTEEELMRMVRALRDRHFGKYRGFVVDNADPDKRGRLKVSVPALFAQETLDWALPCLPFGGLQDQGLFVVPDIGAQVWVEFESGDRNYPLWTGTFWQAQGDAPKDAGGNDPDPTVRVIKTAKGHFLLFNDADNAEQIHLEHSAGATLDIDAHGTMVLTDAGNNSVTLDAQNKKIALEDANNNTVTLDSSGIKLQDGNGNSIEMSASGVKISGQQIVLDGTQVALGGSGGEPIIKGQSFLTLLATHIHTCPPTGGPSTPPIPQGEMSTLSMKVMTS